MKLNSNFLIVIKIYHFILLTLGMLPEQLTTTKTADTAQTSYNTATSTVDLTNINTTPPPTLEIPTTEILKNYSKGTSLLI